MFIPNGRRTHSNHYPIDSINGSRRNSTQRFTYILHISNRNKKKISGPPNYPRDDNLGDYHPREMACLICNIPARAATIHAANREFSMTKPLKPYTSRSAN